MPQKKQDDIYRQAYDQLCAYLSDHNLRPTQERLCILSSVCTLQRFTVDDLRYSLTGILISRATVYNTLELFEKAGVVRHIEKEYGVRAGQYELSFLKSSSVQIICHICGRISEVKDPTITRMLEDKRFTNFILERHSLYLYGRCKKCRKKNIAKTK
jgi:Fur family ferric uptake transcriptional regulator